MDDILTKVKASMQISTDDDSVNTELKGLIFAAAAELKIADVALNTEENGGAGAAAVTSEQEEHRALFERGVILYCKSHFLIDDVQAKRAAAAYKDLKICLSTAGTYKVDEDV